MGSERQWQGKLQIMLLFMRGFEGVEFLEYCYNPSPPSTTASPQYQIAQTDAHRVIHQRLFDDVTVLGWNIGEFDIG